MVDTVPVPLVSLFAEVEDPRRSQALKQHAPERDPGRHLRCRPRDRGQTLRAPEAGLAGHLPGMPCGIPSHDTFGRVFARLDPAQLEVCFTRGVQSLATALRTQVVSVDGKAARRSHDVIRGGHPCT